MSLRDKQIEIPENIRRRIEAVRQRVPASRAGSSRGVAGSWRNGSTASPAARAFGGSSTPPAGGDSNKYVARPAIIKPHPDLTHEDRLLQKIMGKINKLCESNYSEIREWLYENFDPNDSSLVLKILQLIFSKAVREKTYCPTFAKLLRDLSVKFKDMVPAMQNLFHEFPTILRDAETTIDVTDATKEMQRFRELNVEKRYRTGYAQFIGELYNHSIVSDAEVLATTDLLIKSLEEVVPVAATGTTAVEEYVDCLLCIFRATRGKLYTLEGCSEQILRLRELTEAPRTSIPGLTNKARFAILDLLDLHRQFVENGEVREAIVENVDIITSGYRLVGEKTKIDFAASDILECIAGKKKDFMSTISKSIGILRDILTQSATPGISDRSRSTLKKIVSIYDSCA